LISFDADALKPLFYNFAGGILLVFMALEKAVDGPL